MFSVYHTDTAWAIYGPIYNNIISWDNGTPEQAMGML